MTLIAGLGVLAAAIYAILRRVDVRLALLLAALALGALAGNPMAIVRAFLVKLADEQFLVPIGCAMGFAYVLRHTQCDRHLVHLLVRPLRRVHALLIPGTVLVGFCVNIPVISQTSTAVTIGSVLIPLLLAARISPVTVGAALLLGSSIGGELLNPGAPELQTTAKYTQTAYESRSAADSNRPGAAPGRPEKPAGKTGPSPAASVAPRECVWRILPLLLIHLTLATSLFWAMSRHYEARREKEPGPLAGPPPDTPPDFRVSWLKALVPLVPMLLLFLTGPPLNLVAVPREWLVMDPANKAELKRFESRLVGAAMLVGVVAATLLNRKTTRDVARVFFEGGGYAFTHIISLIVIAGCLVEGVKLIELDKVLGRVIADWPGLLLPTASGLPFGLAWLCGSGFATTEGLFRFFAGPALDQGIDPIHVGAVVSIAAAAGRTLSPVAAVTLMCATLTRTDPVDLIKRLAVPLVVSLAAVGIVAGVMAYATDIVYTD
jgi:DcuC family C4-dicarboxylate transporter